MTREPVKLGDVLKQVSRKVVVLGDVEYPELGLRAHGNGTFHKPPVNGSETTKDLYSVEAGDLLLSVVFAWEGAAAVAGPADHGRFTSHRFPAFRCDPSLGVEEYMALWLVHGPGRQLLVANSPGGAGRNKTLNKTALLACTVRLPSVAEQRRIVDLLSTADRLVGTLENEVAAASLVRSEMSTKLLSDVRNRISIGSLLTECKDQLTIDDDTFYTQVTVSGAGRGMRLRERKHGRDIGTKSQRKISPGMLIVSKLGAADGAACVVPAEFDGAVVTQDFPTFAVDARQAHPPFLDIVVRSSEFARQCAGITNGTGQGRIDMKRFGGLEVPLPSLDEQRRIVDLAATADSRLRAAQDKAHAAQTLRDQMLHDLLSGAHTIPESYDRFLAEVKS